VKSVFLVFLLFYTPFISAQILKVDKPSLAIDTSNYWYGDIRFKFDINNRAASPEREVTFIGLNGSFDVGYASKHNEYTFISNFRYFTTGIGPFVSTGYVHLRSNWLRKRRISYESFVQVQYDRGRNLQLRYLAGYGIRITLLRKKKSDFHAGIGLMYENEEWKGFESNFITIDAIKSTNYISAKFNFNERVKLDWVVYYQVGYSDELDKVLHRVNGSINLKLKINNQLDYVTSFQLQYEQTPIIPINRTVYAVSNGLNFRFGK